MYRRNRSYLSYIPETLMGANVNTNPTSGTTDWEDDVGLRGVDLSTGWVVSAQQSVIYDVRLKDGLFDVENRDLLEVGPTRRAARLRRFVVVDETVDAIY